MVEDIDSTIATPTLSDEAIDERGYARLTAAPTETANTVSSFVAGPTKSPPPVLMPRPQPAVHPTLKLTNSFAYDDPLPLSIGPALPLKTVTVGAQPQLDNQVSPESSPKTYLTPPAAPIPSTTKMAATAEVTQIQPSTTVSTIDEEMESISLTEKPEPTQTQSGLVSSSPSSVSSTPIVTNNKATLQEADTTKQREQQQCNLPNQRLSCSPHEISSPRGSIAKKSMATTTAAASTSSTTITMKASSSAPLNSSPLTKSTLASQLSSSSSSTSTTTSTSTRSRYSLKKNSSLPSLSTDTQHSERKREKEQEQQQSQEEQRQDAVNHLAKEKLLYGGKSTRQQLQQDYLLRQNSYLRRQVDALRFDNLESQRQQQELSIRMKHLEAQLLAEKRQTSAATGFMNEYQHHHYYHHNLTPANHRKEEGADTYTLAHQKNLQTDKNVRKDQETRKSVTPTGDHQEKHGSTYKETAGNVYYDTPPSNNNIGNSQQGEMKRQQRPLYQRRHSSHVTPSASVSDSVTSPSQQIRQRKYELEGHRPGHVSFQHDDHLSNIQEQHHQPLSLGQRRIRSRSVPKYGYQHRNPKRRGIMTSDRIYRDNDEHDSEGTSLYGDDEENYMIQQRRSERFLPPQMQYVREDTEDEDLNVDDHTQQYRRHYDEPPDELDSDSIEDDDGNYDEDQDDYYYGYDGDLVPESVPYDDIDDEEFNRQYRYPLHLFYDSHDHLPPPPPPPLIPDVYFSDHYAIPPMPLRRQPSGTTLRQRPRHLPHENPIDPLNPYYFRRPPARMPVGISYPPPMNLPRQIRVPQQYRSPMTSQHSNMMARRRISARPPVPSTYIPSSRPVGNRSTMNPPNAPRRFNDTLRNTGVTVRRYPSTSSASSRPRNTPSAMSSPNVTSDAIQPTSILKSSVVNSPKFSHRA